MYLLLFLLLSDNSWPEDYLLMRCGMSNIPAIRYRGIAAVVVCLFWRQVLSSRTTWLQRPQEQYWRQQTESFPRANCFQPVNLLNKINWTALLAAIVPSPVIKRKRTTLNQYIQTKNVLRQVFYGLQVYLNTKCFYKYLLRPSVVKKMIDW